MLATTRWVYPNIGILGTHQQLRMAEVDADVPGLVGPAEMAKWRLPTEWVEDIGVSVTIRDHAGLHRGPVIWGPKKHPVVDLMDYEGEGTQVFATHPHDDDHDDDDDQDGDGDADDESDDDANNNDSYS